MSEVFVLPPDGFMPRAAGDGFADHLATQIAGLFEQARAANIDPSDVQFNCTVTSLSDTQVEQVRQAYKAAGLTAVLVDDSTPPRPRTITSDELDDAERDAQRAARSARLLGEAVTRPARDQG